MEAAEVVHEECTEQPAVDEDRIQHLPQQHAHGAVTKETVAELLSTHTCQGGPQVVFELCKRRKRRRKELRGGRTGRSSKRLQLVRQQTRRRKRLQKRVSKGKYRRTVLCTVSFVHMYATHRQLWPECIREVGKITDTPCINHRICSYVYVLPLQTAAEISLSDIPNDFQENGRNVRLTPEGKLCPIL